MPISITDNPDVFSCINPSIGDGEIVYREIDLGELKLIVNGSNWIANIRQKHLAYFLSKQLRLTKKQSLFGEENPIISSGGHAVIVLYSGPEIPKAAKILPEGSSLRLIYLTLD